MVRMTADVENNIVAVERIKEYTKDIASEAPWEGGKQPPREWPQEGQVHIHSVWFMRDRL